MAVEDFSKLGYLLFGVKDNLIFQFGLQHPKITVAQDSRKFFSVARKAAATQRSTIFVLPGEPVYRCLIVGEHARLDDMMVNITKEKKLTNIRAAGSDEALRLVPPRRFGLEEAMEFINDHELVEVTLASIRAQKKVSS